MGKAGSIAGKCTFIVVTFNNEETIRRTLTNIKEQTVKGSKTILVDNGSSDRTVAVVKEQFPWVELHRKENIGFAAANNYAAELAGEAEFIALINPDAFIDPEWLEKMLAAAEKHAEAASFGSFQTSEEGDIVDGTGDLLHISGYAWRGNSRKRIGSIGNIKDREIFSPCAAAALYRRNLFLEAGGFDEDYFCYFEDVDLGFRLQLLGYSSWFVSETRVQHVGFSSSGISGDFAIFHGHRNMIFTFFKCMPWQLLPFAIPAHIIVNLLIILGFTLLGKGSTILKAKWHGYSGLGKTWKKRHEIQKKRAVSIWRIASRLNWFGLLGRIFTILFHRRFTGGKARKPLHGKAKGTGKQK